MYEDIQLQERIKSVKLKIERLIEKGWLNEAKAALRQYEDKMPGDPDIYSMLATVLIMEGSVKEAESAIMEGLKKDSVEMHGFTNNQISEFEGY